MTYPPLIETGVFPTEINTPSQEAYQTMKKEYTDAASEKIKQYSSKNDFYYVRQDDLKALIDTAGSGNR